MSMTVIERRMYPRYEYISDEPTPEILVQGLEPTEQWFGSLTDISATGAAIQLSKNSQFRVGEKYSFTMSPLGEEQITCCGRIVRSRSREDGHSLGIEFVDLPLIYQNRLKTKIEVALQKRQESRTREYEGRFQLENEKLIWVGALTFVPIVLAVAYSQSWLSPLVRALKLWIGE
ncbi:MAG: PilZ domain-containing protein [Bdellovibrionales bacterium]|nr:PilZ domain-containing protein [Bdellovibrionales bacterium]